MPIIWHLGKCVVILGIDS